MENPYKECNSGTKMISKCSLSLILSDEIVLELRKIQLKILHIEHIEWSFSKIINLILRYYFEPEKINIMYRDFLDITSYDTVEKIISRVMISASNPIIKGGNQYSVICQYSIDFEELDKKNLITRYEVPILMGKRITVVMDEDLVKKIREKQANMIRHSSNAVSFSSIINQELRKGLKK